ncbi:DUF3800 domain-containing protein [uncultured Adlercreutzia sp.]|uniref:DUF3800 domain-containing protein n=1 Tax=uncultured Adlercreutzia sp. TaxID=875803 RepID=UPI0025EDA53D|nr:DUF3800 domain-containing protein [uncultured Adlercreutzia sp.]MCI9261628.1 DUF3800 domain-containing protein [Eggerthellaceae bacterium]
MNELSIFVDESGDVGETSRYYLVTLVFHNQAEMIDPSVSTYRRSLQDRGLAAIPMHFGPLINGNDSYRNLALDERKLLLSSFQILANRLPIAYKTFSYRKDQFSDERRGLAKRLRRDLAIFLLDNIALFQSYPVVKIYYDNGQEEVTEALHDSIEYALSKEAIIYRNARPVKYTLFQVADYICGIELTALKYDAHTQTKTDERFFGGRTSFRKNFLRKLRKKRID